MFDTVLHIPKNKYHSAILTTFAYDFQYMEEQVRRQLRSKEIYNIVVLVDAKMLQQNLGIFSGNLSHIGKQYTLTPIEAQRTFHPKIILLVGEKESLIQIGSGNITLSGHGENHEIWMRFNVNHEYGSLSFLYEIWTYLTSFTKNASVLVQRQIQWIIENTTLLSKEYAAKIDWYDLDNFQYRFLRNFEKDNIQLSIFQQVTSAIPKKDVHTITIIAPYFDKKALLVKSLAEYFNQAKVKVLVQPHFSILPDTLPKQANIRFYEWNKNVDKALLKNNKKRQHSKIFQFETNEERYLLLGSMNASVAAFGTSIISSKNEEAGILIKSAKQDFLQELGIVIKSKSIKSFDNFPSIDYLQDNLGSTKPTKCKLLSIELVRNTLKIEINKPTDSWILVLFDDSGQVIARIEEWESKENYFITTINRSDLEQVVYGEIMDNNIVISNKQLVNFTENIYKNNPSAVNRSLNKLMEKLENQDGHISLELLDFFDKIKPTKKANSATKRNTNSETKPNETNNLSYSEIRELANKKNDEDFIRTLHNHNTIQILQAIFRREEEYLRAMETADDDTENDTLTDINPPKYSPRIFNAKSLSQLEQRQKNISKYYEKYCKILIESIKYTKNVKEKTERIPITIIDLAKFLILIYFLIDNVERTTAIQGKQGISLPKSGDLKHHKSNERFQYNFNFQYWTYNILGFFTQLIAIKSFGEKKFPDEYSQKQYQDYCEKAFIYGVFTLFIDALTDLKKPNLNNKLNDWRMPLYFNLRIHLIGANTKRPKMTREIQQLFRLAGLQIPISIFNQFINQCEKCFHANKDNLKERFEFYQNRRHRFVMYVGGDKGILEHLNGFSKF